MAMSGLVSNLLFFIFWIGSLIFRFLEQIVCDSKSLLKLEEETCTLGVTVTGFSLGFDSYFINFFKSKIKQKDY